MKRVGIPRALAYYEYYPMWRAFLEALDMEVVVSPPTNRAVVMGGVQRMVAETCLPVKICAGHLAALRDLGVDMVLIPAIKATEPGLFHCSKFLDLPHLMKAVVERLPPIVEVEIDLTRKQPDLAEALRGPGMSLVRESRLVDGALEAARDAHWNHHDRLRQAGTADEVEKVYGRAQPQRRHDGSLAVGAAALSAPPLATPALSSSVVNATTTAPSLCSIGVVGHPYLIYDDYFNHNVLDRLRGLGATVLVPELLPGGGLAQGIRALTGRKYWVYEGEVTGAAGYFLERPDVDGVIALEAFGCGPDSAMMDVVQRAARRLHKPLLTLVLDEHSGEAGILTRLEAFVDMLTRRDTR